MPDSMPPRPESPVPPTPSTITWTEPRVLRVALIEAELRERGELLADALARIDALEGEQKAQREAMKQAMDAAGGQVRKLANVIRERAEERTVRVELRANLTLGLVEEIRVDTGEHLRSRDMTRDDKIRAETLAQGGLFEVPREARPEPPPA